MSTYADLEDLAAFDTTVTWPTDEDDQQRLLDRAERELDAVLGPIPARSDTGLKFDPAALYDYEREALARAVCAQAEHIVSHPTAALERQPSKVSGPDFSEEFETGERASSGIYGVRVAIELAPLGPRRRLAGGYLR